MSIPRVLQTYTKSTPKRTPIASQELTKNKSTTALHWETKERLGATGAPDVLRITLYIVLRRSTFEPLDFRTSSAYMFAQQQSTFRAPDPRHTTFVLRQSTFEPAVLRKSSKNTKSRRQFSISRTPTSSSDDSLAFGEPRRPKARTVCEPRHQKTTTVTSHGGGDSEARGAYSRRERAKSNVPTCNDFQKRRQSHFANPDAQKRRQ